MSEPPTWGSGDVREVRAGEHRIRLESPDLVFVTMVGDVTTEEAIILGGEWERFAEPLPWTLVLADLRRMGAHSPGARKLSINPKFKGRGTATLGATFAQRTMATLLSKAFLLLYPKTDVPNVFVETEAEARAWLAERRKVLLHQYAEQSVSAG